MNKEFVPFEFAVILRTKDFNYKCMAFYDNDGELYLPIYNVDEDSDGDMNYGYASTSYFPANNANDSENIAAPTWQQALAWLEMYHYIDFWAVPKYSTQPKQYEAFISHRGKEISCEILTICFFDSLFDARYTSIEKILNII